MFLKALSLEGIFFQKLEIILAMSCICYQNDFTFAAGQMYSSASAAKHRVSKARTALPVACHIQTG